MTEEEPVHVGVKAPVNKPWVVWLAQAVCGFIALASVHFATKLETQSAAAVLLGMSVLHVVILLALGRRRRWARWLVVCLFGMAGVSALTQGFVALAYDRPGTALYVSSTVTFVVCTIVTVHFLLGESVKAFFVAPPSPPRRPQSRRPRSDDPYAEPSE